MQQLTLNEQDELNTPQKGLNLGPLLRIARRQAMVVSGIAGLVTVAATFLSSKSPSIYSGNFQLLVEPVTSAAAISTEPMTLTRGQGTIPGAGNFELDYATQIKILTSPEILSKIVNKIKFQYPEFTLGLLQYSLTVERLEEESQGENTKILSITYSGTDPKLVELVLKTTAEEYEKYSLEDRKTRIGQGVNFINTQLPKLQDRVNSLQGNLQNLQQQYQLIEPQFDGEQLSNKVRQIGDQQRDTTRQLQELINLKNSLQRQLKLSPTEALASSALSEDPNYQKLLADLKEIESQIAIESARFQPDSPNIQTLLEQRQNLQNLLNRELQRILGQNLGGQPINPRVRTLQNPIRLQLIQQLVDTTNQIEVLQVRNQALIQTKNTVDREVQEFPIFVRKYNDLQRQLQIATQTLNQLETQKETLQVEKAQREVPWEIVSKPQLLRDPTGKPIAESSQNKLIFLGVMGGLSLGMGTVILYDKSRNIFYEIKDIEEGHNLPVLGEIPFSKNPELFNNYSVDFNNDDDKKSEDYRFKKAFDSLYTNMHFRFCNPPLRSIAICSAMAGDGKSSVALNLAHMAASKGQRVLLVDANLHSPQLHTNLNLQNLPGLRDLLSNDQEVVMERSPFSDNLFVLTSGQSLVDSAQDLASTRMEKIMGHFQEKFDLVIYDTPNLLNYTDANFLAANTDGILMVVGLRGTKKSQFKQVLDQIDRFGLTCLGVVVNRVQPSSLTVSP
ncbi:hypothetical protein BJP34_21100 [Moorena producens PAL-8-15-08-1]|uniref:non-specific protein-tyrosine kinase n=1 Tax=Moorena producens PAL-8-15-08-1 TaxID=1458985 RepID=A0A1D8TVB2_9CYAN|nr:tyrosine-protein kinase domain-containing protein [Moorena producens]AOX01602.1 hypothetical protein BJP34_21100 [Moorena producens PAL-8-15-08-1]